ncbi:response regulator transcription factor [Pedobacter riviphilus]|uniref:Response regulator transcription factor n=1 Tax=Pedobacter riviphilus TaxID=2766984 RepID=A0ABX6TMT7_9SPHI|nr:LytTR family DNA-binding domain-containing protein [Pedobacter riviphilus]QNR86821.1 response regulator transcription factor [Pedobacter riviphilus]
MNILIIEDEHPNAERLKRLVLAIKPQAVILDVLDTVSSSVEWLKSNPVPDLILMDIRLADGISFEIFNHVEVKSPIVFTTAYDEYAVRAFKFNSVDYLLKPIEEEELRTALEKTGRRTEDVSAIITDRLQGVIDALENKKIRTRFLIPHKDSYKILAANDVSFFHSEHKITYAHLPSGWNEVVPQNMGELEEQLDPTLFFRLNRQYIVNINAINKVYNHFNSKLKVSFHHYPLLEAFVSRERVPLFKAWLDQ